MYILYIYTQYAHIQVYIYIYIMYIHWRTVFLPDQEAASTPVHHSEAGNYRLQGHAGL